MKKLIILMTLLFSYQAFARVLFDLHAGFGFTPENDQQQGDVVFEGIETGARLGIAYGILIFGADASYGWNTAQFSLIDPSSPDEEYSMKKYDLGFFGGFEIAKLVRIWGSYFPKSEMKFDASGTPTLKGTVAAGGIGLTVLPYVTVNGEVKFYNMNQYTVSGVTTTWTGDDKVNPIEVILTIGFIF